MKIIDLLNKIANGEEVPEKIRFDNMIWNKICGEKNIYYINNNDSNLFIYFFRKDLTFTLNDEVEIIEEEPKPITKESIEALGYAYGEMQKCFTNGWNKSLENKSLKENKEIEKIDIMSDEATPNSYYILNEHGTKCYLTKHSKVIANRVNLLIDKVNNMENNK